MTSENPTAVEGRLVVVGGGTAGAEVAFASRSAGWTGEIIVLSEEAYAPYHRPPLSKDLLKMDAVFADPDPLKGASLYAKKNVDLRLGSRVDGIDATARTLSMNANQSLSYDRLVLAVGGRARELPLIARLETRPSNVHELRTLDDCVRLRSCFQSGRVLMIVGAGYIGLEVAAAAVKAGQRVILLEAATRVLARVTAPVVSQFFEREHAKRGVEILTSTTIESLSFGTDGGVDRVVTSDGSEYHVDNLVVGVGLEPNIELANDAGLEIGNGIVVDDSMTTSDPNILALGDCADFHSGFYDRRVRIESVANAVEHARRAAITLTGGDPKPWQVPWFWSNQYEHSLKIVGLSTGYDETRVIDDSEGTSFAVEYLRDGRLIAVDAINHAAAFQSGKRRIVETIHA
ncbi:FAD-dependent oxidoreductase [Rhodococcus sp. USK10]|uniref:Ferredoxin reductase n=1 Tax=Rhodococcus wratislaviensis TaxID=44752 RepID=A0A402CEU4_RHOWR|nr:MULTISPECIES: FAD-dependent oxidoreductase [Rhodococcus]QYB07119.1 FAD-dependent oxidoreductase [Rhodococcus sp. USK10]GCE42122.1 Ferredoxin reductase [Rhodococcus wratislaviensis]